MYTFVRSHLEPACRSSFRRTFAGEWYAVEGQSHLVEINGSAQDSLGSCDELDYAPCWIDADENGTFAFGPITTGNYTALVDGDMDGFSEIEQAFTVGVDTPTNITLSDPLPPTWDIQFLLLQDGEAVTLESNDTIEFENAYLEGLIPIEANYDPQAGVQCPSYHRCMDCKS